MLTALLPLPHVQLRFLAGSHPPPLTQHSCRRNRSSAQSCLPPSSAARASATLLCTTDTGGTWISGCRPSVLMGLGARQRGAGTAGRGCRASCSGPQLGRARRGSRTAQGNVSPPLVQPRRGANTWHVRPAFPPATCGLTSHLPGLAADLEQAPPPPRPQVWKEPSLCPGRGCGDAAHRD